jgi:hypothetical protein
MQYRNSISENSARGRAVGPFPSGAKAAALGIVALKKSSYEVKTLQEYH